MEKAIPSQEDVEPKDSEEIKLRFHHVEAIIAMYKSYGIKKRLARIIEDKNLDDFDQIYKDPEVVSSLVQSAKNVRKQDLKRHLRGRVAKYERETDGNEARWYAKDYAGKNGIGLEQHLTGMFGTVEQLLLSTPDAIVGFTWGLDSICFSCQGNGQDQPGIHCGEEDMGKDIEWYKALSGLAESHNASNMTESSDSVGRPIYRMPLGVLRSNEVMDILVARQSYLGSDQ